MLWCVPWPPFRNRRLTRTAVNRLDRLTSGLMIMGLTGKASSYLADEFREGTVKKQYVARVKGRFPE
jgi:tRNA pseudouridine synthase 9